MVEQACDLREHHTDVLGTQWHLNAHQLFYRQAVGVLVAHHRHVVQPVHVGQVLDEGLALGQLFSGTVQQANVRIGALDHFTIQLQHQAQHAVRSRVLRTEVQRVVFDFSHDVS